MTRKHKQSFDMTQDKLNTTLKPKVFVSMRTLVWQKLGLDKLMRSFAVLANGTIKDIAKVQPQAMAGMRPVDSAAQMLDELLMAALLASASDLRLEPGPEFIRVRQRVDGRLREVARWPKQRHAELIARIKIMAGLPLDEHTTALDGRFRFTGPKQLGETDVRVAIAPTVYGEYAVLRLLSGFRDDLTLAGLGLSAGDQALIAKVLAKPSGMILVCGPTGCGKTTTLYALLKGLNLPERAIVTIEDPVEYGIDGVMQLQANPKAGLDFARGLRGILRQDPEVIMVGEIRDGETATVAVNAALTGHLLLSTLHTNDALAALPRLLDLKVENYLLTATLSLIIAQRLVRRLCMACRISQPVSGAEAESLRPIFASCGLDMPTELLSAPGCGTCQHSGLLGRVGIFELLYFDEELREGVMRRLSLQELKLLAIRKGMTNMLQDGLQKVSQGLTTVSEVLRVAG